MTPARYQLREDRLRPRFRFLILRLGAFMLLINLALTGKSIYERGYLDPLIDLSAFALFAVILFVVARKQRAAFESAWRSYSLTIDDEGAQRLHAHSPPVSVSANRIKSIVERQKGLTVTGSAGQAFFVPRDLEKYDEVRARLSEWSVIRVSSLPPLVPALMMLAVLGAEVILHYSKQRALILVALLVLLALWPLGAVAIWRAKTMPQRRSSLVLVVLMAAGTLYSIVQWFQSAP